MPTVIRALVLVVAGAALGFAGNAARPHGLRVAAFAPPTECSGGEHGAPSPTVMSPSEASALCGQPNVVIADAVFTATALLVLCMLPTPHPSSDYVVAAALAFLACVGVICAATVWLYAYRSARSTGREP